MNLFLKDPQTLGLLLPPDQDVTLPSPSRLYQSTGLQDPWTEQRILQKSKGTLSVPQSNRLWGGHL